MSSYEETLTSITLDAAAGIASDTSPPNEGPGEQYHFVQISGAHQADLYANTTGQIAAGVLQNKPQVTDMAATVAIMGISLVEAGGAITAGDAVGSDASGRAVSGGTPTLGVAVHGAAGAGELVPVYLSLPGAAAA